MSVNRLALPALLAIAVAGVGVAAYLTSVHYASVPLACSSSGVVNCEQVLTSRYSEVLGLPWSLGGIVWFAVSGLLAVVGLRSRPEPSWLQPAQVVWSLLGVAVVLYLVGVELVALRHICIWCTSMHALIVASFLLSLLRTPTMDAELSSEPKTLRESPRRGDKASVH